MKRFLQKAVCLILLFLLALPAKAYASNGSGNMDGGGSGMGQGTSTNYWTPGYDGVRITVVDASSGSAVSSPVDFSNKTFNKPLVHFAKKNKFQYLAGAALEPAGGSYVYQIPAVAMHYIMTSNSKPANIENTRKYFCSEYAAQMVADATGVSYDSLISGSYKLVVEPIGYFTFNGTFYAMTATEGALYNRLSGGALASKLPSTVHRNLPLALFLETPDLGIPAWTGSSTAYVNDDQILSSLGIGIVSYEGLPEIGLEAPDVTYRVNTDVITSITVNTNREINPDNPANVTFHINGRSYTVNNIVIPEGGSQIVWVKWHTPSEPCRITISASLHRATTAKTSFIADIVDLNENIPPDPTATDTNPRFSVPSIPSNPQNTSAAWSVWYAYWFPDWDWCDHGDEGGHWVDNGWWEFDTHNYSASLSGTMNIAPDDIVPTAQGDTMKSGYGIKEIASARLTINAPASHYAPAQTAVSYFPEFQYQNYWRLLTCSGGMAATFRFQPNEFSTYNRQVHFSPIWFPDHTSYTVYTYVIDAWTPAGMLSLNLNDSVQIDGSLYDDWYSKRE